MPRRPLAAFLPLTVIALSGCSTVASKLASNAVAGGGEAYASDDDPELVRDAVPFGLKTMEGLLERTPRHVGLLTSLAGGFTQYTYAFVQADADVADWAGKLEAARTGRERARRLFLRARDYGLRGLEVRHRGLGEALLAGRGAAALGRMERRDVPLLYWTAAAWALAVSDGKGDMSLVAQLPAAVSMMERALALDESWGEGALHEFFVAYDATRSAAQGGGPERVREHLERALALSHGQKLGTRVSYAEGALVQAQDRDQFTRTLEEVLRADAGAAPRYRLTNVLAQRRARALLAHADDLFP